MSRIGNKPIAIPAGVTVQVDGSTVTVKGAKGELTRTVHSNMAVEVEGATVHVKRPRRHQAQQVPSRSYPHTRSPTWSTGVTRGLSRRSLKSTA